MGIRVTTLIENSGGSYHLQEEHGLSIFVETKQGNILFDTGQSGKFLSNAKALGVDISTINHVVISHSHYDHGGGYSHLVEALEIQPTLHISKYFFREKYALEEGEYYKNGAPIEEAYLKKHGIPIEYVRDKITYIARDVFLVGNFQERCPSENGASKFYIKKNGRYIHDHFREEIALCIKTFEGLVVIVGCSHPGIISMLSTIIKRTGETIYMVIGGTHLIQAEDDRIYDTANFLRELGIKHIGVSHCTGKEATEILSQELAGYFHNHTGTVIEVGKYGEVTVS